MLTIYFNGGLYETDLPLSTDLTCFVFDTSRMYNRGHTITGVEIAEQAVGEFFADNKLEFVKETVDSIGTLYKVCFFI